jgi:hypothetical protein
MGDTCAVSFVAPHMSELPSPEEVVTCSWEATWERGMMLVTQADARASDVPRLALVG